MLDNVLNAVQWPAMAVTLLAAWLVSAPSKRRRNYGFWFFIASNLLWTIWAWHVAAWALIALQAGLLALNLRGARNNQRNARA